MMIISFRNRVLLLITLCLSATAVAQTQPPQRSISVQGSATILVVPNQLEFTVSVEQRGLDTKLLQQHVQKK